MGPQGPIARPLHERYLQEGGFSKEKPEAIDGFLLPGVLRMHVRPELDNGAIMMFGTCTLL
jgi:hypothetical protein